MYKPWDKFMKYLIGANALDFAIWLLPGTVFTRARGGLKQDFDVTLFTDGLVEVTIAGQRALLDVEFQSGNDPRMGRRLLEYSIMASREHEDVPVYSYVIYLRADGPVEQSPLVLTFPDGRETHRFNYEVIELYKMTAQQLLDLDRIGLLPLVLFTEGGKTPTMVEVLIERLWVAGQVDLLAMTYQFGGVAFKTEPERLWFRRRFNMLQDILKESWVYQETIEQGIEQGIERGIAQGIAQGIEQGRQQEHREELLKQREVLVDVTRQRFPKLARLVKREAESIDDTTRLLSLIVGVSSAQTADEVVHLLLTDERE
jgi:hypothetical protein